MSSQRRHVRGDVADTAHRERIPLDACRKLLPPGLSDREVLEARDQLYLLAEFVVSLAPDRAAREALSERAAIMEYDGGLSRGDAENEAVARHMRNLH